MLRPDEELGNFMFSGEDHRVANSIRQLRIVASSTNSHNPVLIKKKKKKGCSGTKGYSTLDIQCTLNRIEFGLNTSTLNVQSSNLDAIWKNTNPLPEVVQSGLI